MKSTEKAIRAARQAQQPASHEPRTWMPPPPKGMKGMSMSAQSAVMQISNATRAAPHLAITAIENVRVLNLDPRVAIYRTEMLEYLKTLKG